MTPRLSHLRRLEVTLSSQARQSSTYTVRPRMANQFAEFRFLARLLAVQCCGNLDSESYPLDRFLICAYQAGLFGQEGSQRDCWFCHDYVADLK